MLDSRNDISLHAYAEDAYLEYAMATVKGRALPQVDGQKPVHRRILFSMQQLGLTSDAKPVKSARIVGDVLGKYHPHGDTAAYDALVRMAQDFSLRYTLIDGQGNFGSRDGDSAAAMRYTEARLTPIARLLLDELGQNTTDMVPNYDGTHQEPSLLPGRLPFVLLNGTMGIAVGMACNIPSHNIREVAAAASLTVSNPSATLDDVLVHIKGPDFPDGGQIISTGAEIREAYAEGRGSVRVRGRWHREELARGQWQLVFSELPYQKSAKMILEQLGTLTNPQPPNGKKTLSQQQINLKTLGLELIERANDESGKEHKIRLVISPRNAKVSLDDLLAYLFANTDLESNAPVNLTVVGLDGNPRTKSLLTLLQEWSTFRLVTVRRRTEYQLSAAQKRIHTLEGRHTAFLNLDAVVKVVRTADDAKAELQSRFNLSESQAEDILEMKLRQLNKLEGLKLEQELAELRKLVSKLEALLASEKAMRALVVSEIEADAAKFGDDRRTLIKAEARAQSSAAIVRSTADEAVTLFVSKNLWVRTRPGHDVDAAAIGYRAGDEQWIVLKTRTSRPLVLLDNKGRSYSVRVSDLPGGRGDGVPLTTFVELQPGAKVLFALSAADEDQFLFASQGGYGLLAPFKNLVASKRAGKEFLDVEGHTPLPPVAVGAQLSGNVACGTDDGRLLIFPASEILARPSGGKGVKLMELGDAKLLHFVHCTDALQMQVELKSKALDVTLQGAEFDKYLLHRMRKGYAAPKSGNILSMVASST